MKKKIIAVIAVALLATCLLADCTKKADKSVEGVIKQSKEL
jgi:hypothetical protein